MEKTRARIKTHYRRQIVILTLILLLLSIAGFLGLYFFYPKLSYLPALVLLVVYLPLLFFLIRKEEKNLDFMYYNEYIKEHYGDEAVYEPKGDGYQNFSSCFPVNRSNRSEFFNQIKGKAEGMEFDSFEIICFSLNSFQYQSKAPAVSTRVETSYCGRITCFFVSDKQMAENVISSKWFPNAEKEDKGTRFFLRSPDLMESKLFASLRAKYPDTEIMLFCKDNIIAIYVETAVGFLIDSKKKEIAYHDLERTSVLFPLDQAKILNGVLK